MGLENTGCSTLVLPEMWLKGKLIEFLDYYNTNELIILIIVETNSQNELAESKKNQTNKNKTSPEVSQQLFLMPDSFF